ncbi:MAG: hypothetical protein BGN88_09945 [Clostridiales bacterium 43-6]|nr:MAG: hypothetical protein BGN88_09945 [Clostridiales bacterium 43-6]
MTVHLVTNEKVAETSSKGNQEKWYDNAVDKWYKLDQFGYEALSEAVISALLERSNIEKETPFQFARYHMEKLNVHGRDRTGCSSKNFLKQGQSIVTISHLFGKQLNGTLKQKLEGMTSDKKRIAYLADQAAELTGLHKFPQYLTLLFEVDALFLNDDRHLNNIAVLEQKGKYDYCPIFDNGAGLLSNMQMSPMDIAPKGLMSALHARPFYTTFTRQMNTARSLYGKQLIIPALTKDEIFEELQPMLEYYAQRDRGIITDRVTQCILTRQKLL